MSSPTPHQHCMVFPQCWVGAGWVLGTGLVTLMELAEGQDKPPSLEWPVSLLLPLRNWEGSRKKGWELLEVFS